MTDAYLKELLASSEEMERIGLSDVPMFSPRAMTSVLRQTLGNLSAVRDGLTPLPKRRLKWREVVVAHLTSLSRTHLEFSLNEDMKARLLPGELIVIQGTDEKDLVKTRSSSTSSWHWNIHPDDLGEYFEFPAEGISQTRWEQLSKCPYSLRPDGYY